jgi:hypothetical protein
MEFPPESIPAILQALREHPVVYTSRFLSPQILSMTPLRRAGNRLISGIFNWLFGQRTTDLCTGMKGLRRSGLNLASLRCDGFEHNVELSVLAARTGTQIYDVAIDYVARSRGSSKMRHVPEAIKFVALTIAYRLGYDRKLGQPAGKPQS